MSKLIKNSGIYSLLNLLQKGINFLLVPVLTSYLTTHDFGIVAVVTVINSFLNVLYLCALNGSINRFYYEYKEDKEKIERLFGTILTFVFLLSVFLTALLVVFHPYVLKPFLKDIDFYPYMMLGLISTLLNPIFTIYQDVLMAKQLAQKFGKNSFLFFLTNLTFLLLSIVVFGMKAEGVIGSLALTNILFFIYTITRFRKELVLGIDWNLLKHSLRYSIPLIPHSIAGVTTSVIDKVIINNLMTTSLVGIYHVGNTFGGIIFIISSSVNKAFVPWFNEKVKKGELQGIPTQALVLINAYCLIALFLSLFGENIINLVAPSSFHASWKVIPFISFAFVLHGVYYFFSIPMFYDISGKGNRMLPIATIFTALVNVTLNFVFIPYYGIIGAAIATIISKFILVMLLLLVYRRFLDIKYRNAEMIVSPLIYFSLSLVVFMEITKGENLYKFILMLLAILITYFRMRNHINTLIRELF